MLCAFRSMWPPPKEQMKSFGASCYLQINTETLRATTKTWVRIICLFRYSRTLSNAVAFDDFQEISIIHYSDCSKHPTVQAIKICLLISASLFFFAMPKRRNLHTEFRIQFLGEYCEKGNCMSFFLSVSIFSVSCGWKLTIACYCNCLSYYLVYLPPDHPFRFYEKVPQVSPQIATIRFISECYRQLF